MVIQNASREKEASKEVDRESNNRTAKQSSRYDTRQALSGSESKVTRERTKLNQEKDLLRVVVLVRVDAEAKLRCDVCRTLLSIDEKDKDTEKTRQDLEDLKINLLYSWRSVGIGGSSRKLHTF